MTTGSVLGQPALFRLTDEEELPTDLSVRESRLLVGALNFHALMAPSRELTVHAYSGDWSSLPRTTDDSTFTGESTAYHSRAYSFRMASTVEPEQRAPIEAEAASLALAARDTRHLHVSRDTVLAYDPPRELDGSALRRAARAVRARTPLLYDELRDLELLRHRRPLHSPVRRHRYEREFQPGGEYEHSRIVPAGAVQDGAPRAVLFGLHWFELGGAERWAFESVRIARDAGFLPIVLTNRDSHQPWIDRPELDGALLIPFSEESGLASESQTPGVEELLRALFRLYDIRGVMVHHNQWLYDRLGWIARSRPGIPIVDSTHIVEYRGGGYPVTSAIQAEAITIHHVISPTLARWMTQVQGIEADKVVMAPLGGLTVDVKEAEFRVRADGERFTVAFVGRMARQKAPEVFIAMAQRLRREGHDLRLIMHGDGEMASWVDELIERAGLVVERRHSSVPVSQTLDESHLLVVPSHNEGLTLTTLEAIAHGVPVVSTDVGGQSDIIPRRALSSRYAHRAAAQLARAVASAIDEDARRQLWREERKAEKRLLKMESASTWFEKEVRSW
ncbi:glycosyltransferase [Microbacterium stercoris]|uniref:D-inositol 3-phosphate glycosyltransferase n=1 Tax=Microbacterium stercoris TaxID=2820289 RepID=A0A939QM76_9MICO|nr:glycosyltransferase [Microbacterium stercoris]MBO3662031.1 glycosyltransferase [Microbacterium stercoris]